MPQHIINLKIIEPPSARPVFEVERHWRVYLGGSQYKTFGTKRLAMSFLADMSAFLDLKLRELSRLTGLIYVDYRTIWFRLPSHAIRVTGRLFVDLDDALQRDIMRGSSRTLYENNLYLARQASILRAIVAQLDSIDHATNTDYRYRLRMHALEIDRIEASFLCYAENKEHLLALDQRITEV